MDARDELCAIAIARIFLQKQFPGLLVQRGLGIGVYEKAFNSDKDMANPILRFPVFLESADANLAIGANIRMKDLRGKPTFRRSRRKLVCKPEFYPEVAPRVGCAFRSLDDARNIQQILLIRLNANALRRVLV